jgi:hypothetical protein
MNAPKVIFEHIIILKEKFRDVNKNKKKKNSLFFKDFVSAMGQIVFFMSNP